MDFYLRPCNQTKIKNKTKILLPNNIQLLRYERCYNGNKSIFYTDDSILSRNMYVYIGDFLEKLVLSYLEINEKCSNASIRAAFENCPYIYEYLRQYANGYDSPIIYFYANNRYYYCIKKNYCTLFNSKKATFYSLNGIASAFRKEIPLINVSLLKPSYKLRAKKFFAENGKNALKFVVRAGAIVAAAAVGANLDLPDFDFDVDVPDVDIPNFDNSYNLSLDSGLDPSVTSGDYGTSELTNEASNSNISFGSSRESLERELRDANHNMEYYERQIDNFNDSMSSTYRQTCLNGYDDAAKKAKEIADKLSRLQS